MNPENTGQEKKKMVSVLIQLPLNISRALEETLREHIESSAGAYQAEIILKNTYGCGGESVTDWKQADILIGFLPELAMQTDAYIREHYVSAPGRFPMKQELQDQGFADSRGCFQVFGVVPFIMFYNPEYTDAAAVPRTWGELLAPQWKGRIIMPGKEHMAPRVIRAVQKYEHWRTAPAVEENITCRGLPPNVIEAVKKGEFALGITNVTFGKIAASQKIRMIWPEDGLLCMPQIMAWKKGLGEQLMKLGDFMLSPKVQDLLTQQAFVPMAPGAAFPEIISQNKVGLKWIGWDHFREAMRQSEIEI